MKFIAPSLFVVLIAFTTHCKTVRSEDSESKFGSGEHLILGDEGYRQAMGLPKNRYERISRADGHLDFTYGEIVALSGDFYDTFEALDSDRERRPVIFDSGYNDIPYAIKLFRSEIKSMEQQKTDAEVEVPDYNLSYLWAFGPEYLGLALCNIDHFGWHNMKRYVNQHGKALALAVQAHKEPDAKKKAELWRKARVSNGFADHFLTDSFASGHVRVPRLQALVARKVECVQQADMSRVLKDSSQQTNANIVGVLAKIQHDNDHRYEKTGGLKVLNSRGDKWKTRADGDLYILDDGKSPTVKLATEAVRLSVQEVLAAYKTGELPDGVYKATELVPYIDPSEDTFADTFSPNLSDEEISGLISKPVASLKELLANPQALIGVGEGLVKSIVAGVKVSTVREYFSTTPALMQAFRDDVASDIAQDAELSKRLPLRYLDGFKKVQ